jgi:antirestriction protein ArdC
VKRTRFIFWILVFQVLFHGLPVFALSSSPARCFLRGPDAVPPEGNLRWPPIGAGFLGEGRQTRPSSASCKKKTMNTHPKYNNEQGSGLLSHPEQLSKQGTSKHSSVYDIITERIIVLLEQGTIPWHKPWNVKRGFPRNLVSKKPYRGVNVFLLHAMHYESPFWLTFNQAKQLGAHIRKGEKACPVVFWKQLEVEDKDTHEIEKIPMLRFYHVWNIAQVEGLNELPDPIHTAAITKPAEIVANMPQRPEIKSGFAKAFYSPGEDFVGMPNRERFTSEDEFYSVLFHELTHSTGHESRLNRPGITEASGFSSDEYSREELIAEMGSAFLCGQAGIVERTLNNSAAYLQNWLEALKNDRKLIVQAAAQAQKAADFILGTKFEEEPTFKN